MSTKAVSTLLALAVVGVLTLVLLRDGGDVEPVSVTPGRGGLPARSGVEPQVDAEHEGRGESPAGVARAPAGSMDNAGTDRHAVDDSAAGRAEWRLSGRVVVVNGKQGPRREEDGEIEIRAYSSKRSRTYTVPVHAGGFWVVHDSEIHGYRVRALVLGGRETEPVSNGRESFEGGEVEVHGRWVPRLNVRVLDASTGGAVEDVSLVVGPRSGWQDFPPLRQSAWLVGQPWSSSHDIPRGLRHGGFRLFARAPGYAWAAAAVDGDRDQDVSFELSPGGELEVQMVGEPRGVSVHLDLADERSVRALEGRDVARFEGLPVGSYWVRGEDESGYTVVGTAAKVTAHEVARVQLAVPVAPAPVRVAGTVFVPPDWEPEFGRVELRRVLAREEPPGRPPDRSLYAVPSQDREKYWSWSADLLPGEYDFALLPVGFATRFAVPGPGTEDLHFEVPRPGRLSLEFVERGTGQPVRVTDVTARPVGVGSSGCVRSIGPEPDTGRFEILAPRGPIQVAFATENGLLATRFLDVGPGLKRQAVEVASGCLVEILPKAAGALTWVGKVLPEVNGPGEVLELEGWGRGYHLLVEAPGRYTVRFPLLPGFKPVAPFEVDARRGAKVRQIVELEPR